jgi:predicted MFS family arabinose efflux permease
VPDPAAPRSAALPWAMLFALTAAFAMSQAFRTVGAILAAPLRTEFGLSPQQLGTFAGAFHFAFGALQLFMGVGIDLHGVRRTVLAAFPLAVAGAVLSALAPGFATLVAGQVLIGIGCAPAFLVCTVFIARHFPPARFAAISGMVMSVGGLGLLATGTPLAWLVEATSWRMGFWVLAACSAAAWALIAWQVHEPSRPGGAPRESLGRAVLAFGALLRLPWTWGIVALSFVCYASFISLRGLWLGPLLIERHGFSLVSTGHVVLAVSAISLVGPALFGRFDPGGTARRRMLVGYSLALAAMFVALAWGQSARVDVVLSLAIGLMSGYMILQYGEVRSAYPAGIVGRALALFTMAMFMGVALMQWFTGFVASQAAARNADVYGTVLLTIAVMLGAGALAFALLPKAPATASSVPCTAR